MNRKQLGILLVLVVLIGGAGLIVLKRQKESRSAGNTTIGQKLIKDFPVNDVTHVAIRQGTNAVNLVKMDEIWKVAERQDYPVDFSKLSKFLLELRDLKAVQTEQIGPSQLPRLELATGQGTNSPTVVEFKGANDKSLNTLLLGKMHMSSGRGASQFGGEGGWPDGRYVMVGTNSENVAVISSPFEDIQPKPEQWLNKDFVHVEKPKTIAVEFPVATNSWKLTRETESGEWKLADAKPEEHLDSSKTSGVTSPFSSPSFNDVLSGDQVNGTGTNQPTIVTIETFDGFQYRVKVGGKTNGNYLVSLSVNAQLPKERVAGKDEKAEDKAKLDKEFADQQKKLGEKLKREQGFGNWTYEVTSWSVDPVLKKRSELLEEKKVEGKPGSDSETNELDSAEAPKLENPPLPAITNAP